MRDYLFPDLMTRLRVRFCQTFHDLQSRFGIAMKLLG
jgi:hypothetical protein